MIYLTLLTLILSLYVIFESLSAIANMTSGLIHFCHKIKYVLAFSSSIAFIYYAFKYYSAHDISGLWLVFGSSGTLAFFVWPRTVYRFKSLMRVLNEFEGEFL